MFTVKLFLAGVVGSYFSDDIPDLSADIPADGSQFFHDSAGADPARSWRWPGWCLWRHGRAKRIWDSRRRRVHKDHDRAGGVLDSDGRLSGHDHAWSGEAGGHIIQQVFGRRKRNEG